MHRLSFPLLCFALLALPACSGSVRDTLGLTTQAPDEFRVVSRPPLVVPPEFNLRPPAQPGEAISGTVTAPASEKAGELVLGKNSQALKAGTADTAIQKVSGGDSASGPDAQFLKRAGANQVDSSVRTDLRQQESIQSNEERGWLDRMGDVTKKDDSVVDADKEANRLKKNKDTGKSATEGDTPVETPKKGGFFNSIFGD